MKNNKLTLKALKQELELLKVSKSNSKAKLATPTTETHKSTVAHDIKNSYIQNLHMKSSMFTLWIITTVLAYAHKIPFIGRIITLLSLWYGRTTIWKILVKVRKAFILFNALIGVYMVFKSVGFSYDNILAGFAGMGHTYLEVLFNFSKRLFNWFFELFDYKVVPNVPNNPPSAPTSWWSSKQSIYHPRGLDQAWRMNLPDLTKISSDLFNPGININININTTPWYKDFSTLLWIGGIASVFGVCYFGYKFLVDPTFIENINIFKVDKGKLPETQITPASPGSSTGSISDLTKSIFLSVRRATYKLNLIK